MTTTTDRLVPTRDVKEICARCGHAAGQHRLGTVRAWEYCERGDCLCPGWCSTLECATCDYGSPRWAGYSQCLGCLDYHVKPCDYVYKSVIAFDAEAAIAEIRWHRGRWEVTHPHWQLGGDQEHLFPETVAPSKYADRETSMGRKLFGARFRVVRRHPTVHAKPRRLALSDVDLRDCFDTSSRILTSLLSDMPILCSGGAGIETPVPVPCEEIAPGISRAPLDWKTYVASVPLGRGSHEEAVADLGASIDRSIANMKKQLDVYLFGDRGEGVEFSEERYEATCDHCGGFWDCLFASQEEADQWLMQHRGVCLAQPPPSLWTDR